ncbi:GntR family transcriptional regulator [Burkholderia ubonensis]|uniref:FCD domain-containing protein n=1 Tax=Burkholderia ubonensis TaxID=101571 RepID=UPI00075C10C8|nr:FCD domain-containing protein [Burkholderia ubonensis]KVO04672.1 GntR family transcriptional regulator [Burkholderia ubonensis]KVO23794.1 GntR family transcriptional regulator [Burkholderia ubonensis]KVQ74318.1 GntR family transcriptional regulator [Burkholderia ubonensis]KVT96407.1 GntR family transcriptional regulator [Burkholderia ubonensis]KVX46181.1 GntR family transcriptional regulator [Burkholderia ubonensis]
MISSPTRAPRHAPSTDPAVSQTISEKAYKLLRADIIAGRLAPGEKLRLQSLQTRYELGVSPIREALMLLCGDELVTNEGQRGFSVAPLSRSDLLDLTSARIAIEQLLLADSIAQGDDDWGADITAAYYKLTKARLPTDASDVAAVELWETAHRRFHFSLVAAATSKWLLRMDEQLVDHSERYRRIRLAYPRAAKKLADDVLKEHRDLMEAVLDRDTAKALELLRQHLTGTAEALLKRFGD